MTHKNDRLVILTVLLFALITLASCTRSELKQPKFSRMEVIYVEHWRMTYMIPLSYEKLMRGDFPYHQVEVTDTEELRRWAEALNVKRLQRVENASTGDCRVCCRFFSENGGLIHEFSMWPAGVKIDGTVYYMDSTFMRLLEPHLSPDYFR